METESLRDNSVMGYIPPDAKWYLADIVEQATIEDDPRRVIPINTILIHADSPEAAAIPS